MNKRKVITKQGIFNHVYRFLVKQGRPSRNLTGCCYRAVSNGQVLACAAGCLLSDKEAERIQEQSTWSAAWNDGRRPERFDGFEGFIQQLQDIHDQDFTCDPETGGLDKFRNIMASFAALHGLTVPND